MLINIEVSIKARESNKMKKRKAKQKTLDKK